MTPYRTSDPPPKRPGRDDGAINALLLLLAFLFLLLCWGMHSTPRATNDAPVYVGPEEGRGEP